MPVPTSRFRLLCAVLLLAAACQAPGTPTVALMPGSREINHEDFPAPRHLLRGFDYRTPAGPMLVGDEVLFGLRLRRDTEVTNWLLQLRVIEVEAIDAAGKKLAPVDWPMRINGEVESFASELCRAEVVVMDEHGKELGRSQPVLPRDFLASGIAPACRLMHTRMRGRRTRSANEDPSAYRRVDKRPLAEATVTAVALLQTVQDDAVLAPILWQVVERPSLWSIVSNLSVDVVLRPSFHTATPTTSPVPALREQTWRLPIALEVNTEPALNLDLFVTDSTPPFTPAGGLLGATARHPTNPTLDFTLLLSARRR